MSSSRKRLRTREVLERLGQVRAGDQLVAAAGLGEQDPRRAGQAVGDRRPPSGIRRIVSGRWR